MRFLFSLLIVLSLLIAPAIARASDVCVSKNCETSISSKKEIASKSQPDSKKPFKADHCCACGGSHVVFQVSLSVANNIEHLQEKPLFRTAVLSGIGPQSPLEPPRTI